MASNRILSIGEVLWDLFPDGPRFGGAPANFACHTAALGGRVSIVSAVGDDSRGHDAIDMLRAYGINTSFIQHVADAPTGSVGVKLDVSGKPTFDIHEHSAWDQLTFTPELESHLAEVDAVYFGTLGQRSGKSRATIQRAMRVAKARGILRVLDVNLRKPFFSAALIRESVGLANILKLSDDELHQVAEACDGVNENRPETILRTLLDRHQLKLVVMTRGAEGCLLVSADETIDQPGIPTKVRDTVGAGDCFTAVLVVGLLRGDTLRTIARDACETAAAVCAQSGAVPNLFTSTKVASKT